MMGAFVIKRRRSMISVLMPVYNAGEYLYKSIGSIQAQTFQDFEIIAVNDGSTDNSLEILQALAKEDERIRIISREEKGYAITMNEALDNARGEYVINVDPDDWIEPNMFRKMLDEMDEGIDFVKCAFMFELPENRQEEYYYADKPIEFRPRTLPPDLKCRFFSSQIAIWTMLIRREFIERHHIRLNPTEGAAYQDTAFVFQCNACADKVRVIPDILYHYNKTNMNASTRSARYPLAPSIEYRFMADWCEAHPEYGMYVRSVLCRCRYGSYMWNMKRINAEDRLEFALMVMDDFRSDWNWIDVRMFSKGDFDLFLIGKDDAVGLVSVFKKLSDEMKMQAVANSEQG